MGWWGKESAKVDESLLMVDDRLFFAT